MIVAAEPGLAAGPVSPDHGQRRGPVSTQNRGPVSMKIDSMFAFDVSGAATFADFTLLDYHALEGEREGTTAE